MRAYQSIETVETFSKDVDNEESLSNGNSLGKTRSALIAIVVCALGIAGVTKLTGQNILVSKQISAVELNDGPNKTDAIKSSLTSRGVSSSVSMDKFHPTDGNATNSTKRLLESLRALQETDGVGFGHHYDNYVGQDFWAPKGQMNKSDVHSATGEYPLLFGYDLYQYMNGANWTRYARWAHHKGSAVVVSWWATNPVNGEEAHDCKGDPVTALMPGGKAHKEWMDQLNQVVKFFNKFQDVDGEQIPVIFRMFREPNTDHWWWGKRCSSPKEYHEAFEFSYNYIQSRTHNILWAYSPCQVSDDVTSALDIWYPGDHVVDIVAADRYSSEEDKLAEKLLLDCEVLTEFGRKYNKVVGFAEFGILDGIQDLDDGSFFHHTLLKSMTQCLQNVSFVSMWANYSPEKYWTPLPGEKNSVGFKEFVDSRASIMNGDDRWRELPYYKGIESSLGNTKANDVADLKTGSGQVPVE